MVAWILETDNNADVEKFLDDEGLNGSQIWGLDVPEKGVKIAELRSWLKMNSLSVRKGDTVVFKINGADNLSEQCQNVLLKPLEESRREVLFVLIVKSKLGLLPTIVSRCKAIKIGETQTGDELDNEEVWSQVVEAWKAGPGASIGLLDNWGKDRELPILNLLLVKLAKGLRAFPSMKRVRVLKLALELKRDSRLMVNKKLLLGRFLLEGWKISGL